MPQLAAGEHTLTAITYGADGEVQASSKPLTVTVSEPEPAAAAGPVAVQPKIGWPPDGSAVVSARPLVAGQSFPRGVVRIYDGATLLGETIADANGYWSFRPSVALTAGEHVLTAVATSADGTGHDDSAAGDDYGAQQSGDYPVLEAVGRRSPDGGYT